MSSRRSSVHSSFPKSRSIASKKLQRDATIYDAVAGRVSTQRFIPPTPHTSYTRDTQTSSTLPIPPEEVLFRRLGAPERDVHDDFYWANRHLTANQTLPDSDLLKAVHAYAADFYGAMGENGEVMFRSMDETALLAMGVLMEEAAEELLGPTGDTVFVDGEKIDNSTTLRDMRGEAVEHDTSGEGQDGLHSQADKEASAAEKSKATKKRKKR